MKEDKPAPGVAPPGDGMSAVKVAFPQTTEDFERDPRVSYSKLEQKWILEENDGTEWEWIDLQQKWVPALEDVKLEQQQQAYAVEGVDETESTQSAIRKRKKEQQSKGNGQAKKARTSENRPAERKNTAVYVTSLPFDTTADEVHQVFSRYGVIAEEIDSDKPRIKLYTDADGNFKGDALVVFFRPESVSLAIQMLDDSDFRLGQRSPTGNMRVREADSSYKKQQAPPLGESRAKQVSAREKQKIIKRTQQMNNKLADWDDDDPQEQHDTNPRWDKVLVLRHMFTLEEINGDPAAILDIKEDVREECSKVGEVSNVQLFDKEPDGVITVRFSNSEAARACLRLMDGRHFDGQTVKASIADGTERFKKTKDKQSAADEVEAGDEDDTGDEELLEEREEGKRMEDFGDWLENEGMDD